MRTSLCPRLASSVASVSKRCGVLRFGTKVNASLRSPGADMPRRLRSAISARRSSLYFGVALTAPMLPSVLMPT